MMYPVVFYLLFISLFIFLYYLAEKGGSIWYLIMAMIPPILFEGLRDELVGTDMSGYGTIWFYNMSINSSILRVIRSASTPEYGYHLLIYFCKSIYRDVHLYMTACAAIKIVMVYLTAWKLKEQMNSIVFLAGYFLFFYVLGFSMMRQSIAIAICIYSIPFLLTKQFVKFSSLVIIAYFFHNSAIMMFAWLPLLYIRNWKLKYVLIAVGSIIIFISISTFMSFLIGSSLFKEGIAEHYMNSGVKTSKTMIILCFALMIYGLFLKWRKKYSKSILVYLIISASAFSLVFIFLAYYVEVAYRMAYYMVIGLMVLVLLFIEKEKMNKLIFETIYVALFYMDFYISSTHGLAGTLNYSSKILGL